MGGSYLPGGPESDVNCLRDDTGQPVRFEQPARIDGMQVTYGAAVNVPHNFGSTYADRYRDCLRCGMSLTEFERTGAPCRES